MQESYGHPAGFALLLLPSLVCMPPQLPVFMGAFVSTRKLPCMSLGTAAKNEWELSVLHSCQVKKLSTHFTDEEN